MVHRKSRTRELRNRNVRIKHVQMFKDATSVVLQVFKDVSSVVVQVFNEVASVVVQMFKDVASVLKENAGIIRHTGIANHAIQ